MVNNTPTCSKLVFVGDDDTYIVTHDLETKDWNQVCTLRNPARFFKVANFANRVIIAGGQKLAQSTGIPPDCQNAIHIFDSETNQVSYDCGTLPHPLTQFQMCTHGSHLYILGGKKHDKEDPIPNFYRCEDDGKWAWNTLSPMGHPLFDFSSVIYKNYIYVFGGNTGNNVVSDCAKYDIRADVWSTICSLPVALSGTAAAVYFDEIYVGGGNYNTGEYGFEEMADVYIYDVKTNSWRNGPVLNYPRATFTMSNVNGKLYAVGGVSGDDIIGSYEILEDGAWVEYDDSYLDGFLDGGVNI